MACMACNIRDKKDAVMPWQGRLIRLLLMVGLSESLLHANEIVYNLMKYFSNSLRCVGTLSWKPTPLSVGVVLLLEERIFSFTT